MGFKNQLFMNGFELFGHLKRRSSHSSPRHQPCYLDIAISVCYYGSNLNSKRFRLDIALFVRYHESSQKAKKEGASMWRKVLSRLYFGCS
jgi:hypothetical protein